METNLEKFLRAAQDSPAFLKERIKLLEEQKKRLREALRASCPPGIEDSCDECNGGPCMGCWIQSARAILAETEES